MFRVKVNRGNKFIYVCMFWQFWLFEDFEYVCILKILFFFNCLGLKEVNCKLQRYKKVIFLNKSCFLTVGKFRIIILNLYFKVFFLKNM